MADKTPTQELCEQLELAAHHSPYWRKLFGESKSLIEDQAARIAELERVLDGVTQEMIDGGWTAQGIRRYAKMQEDRVVALEAKCALLAASLGQEEKRVEVLEAQLQQRGEPVAWMWRKRGSGTFAYTKTLPPSRRHQDGVTKEIEIEESYPLYRWHPPAASASEDLTPHEVDIRLGSQMYIDSSQHYRNGTMTVTIKRKPRDAAIAAKENGENGNG
jgi:hypothetical protein